MTRLARSILPLLFSFCVGPLAVAQNGSTQEVQRIVERYVQSTGGYGALEQIESVRIEAIIETKDGNILNLTVLKKKPNLVRVSSGKGMRRLVRGYDGRKAWEMPPYASKAVEMTGAAAAGFIRDAMLESPLIRATERGIHLELLGTETVNGHLCHDILVVHPDGTKTHYFIDSEEYVERKFLYEQGEGADKKTVEIFPSEYEKVGGLLFAFRTDSYVDGEKESTILVQDVSINPGILDAAFRMP